MAFASLNASKQLFFKNQSKLLISFDSYEMQWKANLVSNCPILSASSFCYFAITKKPHPSNFYYLPTYEPSAILLYSSFSHIIPQICGTKKPLPSEAQQSSDHSDKAENNSSPQSLDLLPPLSPPISNFKAVKWHTSPLTTNQSPFLFEEHCPSKPKATLLASLPQIVPPRYLADSNYRSSPIQFSFDTQSKSSLFLEQEPHSIQSTSTLSRLAVQYSIPTKSIFSSNQLQSSNVPCSSDTALEKFHAHAHMYLELPSYSKQSR